VLLLRNLFFLALTAALAIHLARRIRHRATSGKPT
jgi:hypothetical protein